MQSITRRTFTRIILPAFLGPRLLSAAEPTKHRELRFRIGEGFGQGLNNDIEAVLHSAGHAIWQHCPQTFWQVRGFYIYYREPCPIADFVHTADDCIAIGLATNGTYWCQYAYQFAHEFCHALVGHSNDWKAKDLGGVRPNHWLEESICEVASLFVLRDMGNTWKTHPPRPNWRSFAEKLTTYADEHIAKSSKNHDEPFIEWFRKRETEMRQNSTMREYNDRVALELLPLFEKDPAGWETMACFKIQRPKEDESLVEHLTQWHNNVEKKQQDFVRKIAAVFEVKLG